MGKEYVISVFSENQAGVLHRISTVFVRRKINIESLKVSETSKPGISKFTITARVPEEGIDLLVHQIEKIVEVFKAEYKLKTEN